jgi:Phage phiEco32-like COOH.NH2 ligase-type 2
MLFANVKVGSDPEFFLTKDEKFIPAFKFLKGTKLKPTAIDDQGSAVLHDNVMVEFNTIPATTSKEFVVNINKVLSHLRETIPKDVVFKFIPSASFDDKELTHRKALEFGCEPDFNAYQNGDKNTFSQPWDLNLRTSGGHIHVGYDNPRKEVNLHLIRSMDLHLGLPSLFLDTEGDKRREMYGKAGAFRHKPYGCEYRVLSNFWIKSDELKEWTFNSTIASANFIDNGMRLSDRDMAQLEYAINESDKNVAKSLLEKFHIEIPNL